MFFHIIFSCFPPTQAKRDIFKMQMMRQNYIESRPDLAHALIDKEIEFDTLEKVISYDCSNLDLLALRFKNWITKHWDMGDSEKLPETEKKRIQSLLE